MAEPRDRASLMDIYDALDAARHDKSRKSKVAARPVANHGTAGTGPIAVAQQIDDIEQERKRLENQDFAQNTALKARTLRLLFRFLAIETGMIFAFAFAQATRWPAGFHMEEWSFKLLVTATIAQITGMVFVAVRYLFPKSNS